MMMRWFLSSLMILAVGSIASAHPGHGSDVGQGGVAGQIQHQVTEPIHLTSWVLLSCIALTSVILVKRLRNQPVPAEANA